MIWVMSNKGWKVVTHGDGRVSVTGGMTQPFPKRNAVAALAPAFWGTGEGVGFSLGVVNELINSSWKKLLSATINLRGTRILGLASQ